MQKSTLLITLGIVTILSGMVAAMLGATMTLPTWLAIIGAFVAIAGIITALPQK